MLWRLWLLVVPDGRTDRQWVLLSCCGQLKIQKIARTKTKVFLDSNGHNLFRTVEKTLKNQTVWSQWSFKNKKIQTDFAHFPRPGENDPYMKRHNLKQAIWGHIWKHIVGKSLKNATSVNMQPSIQTFWGLIGKKKKKHPVEKSNKCNQFDFACWINPSINQLGPKGPQLEVGAWGPLNH